MRPSFVAIFAFVACFIACSEATDGLVPPDDTGIPEAGVDASVPEETEDASPSEPATSSSVVLINEISGEDEWIEIVNSGTASVDLGGWKLADRDKTTGEPKLSEAVTFAPGTKFAAKAYGMVVGGGLDAGKDCPTGGQVFCINAEFGISKSGETLFLIDDAGETVGTVMYPGTITTAGDTWSRVPDGDPDGPFEARPGTPGEPNGS